MAEKKFSLFHLSLLPVEQLDFSTVRMSREEWLRYVFSSSFSVEYRANQELVWVPKLSPPSEGAIIGVIQKQKPHSLHRPPEQGGEEITEMEWQGAYALLDPSDNKRGQRIAIENDVVGIPSALLSALIFKVNERPERPFNIEFDAIFDGGSFWQFAREHDNILEWVKFDFSAPNMWGAKTELDRELRDTREDTGAERVKVELKSRQGIRAKSQKIKDGVDYAERGAGEITAKSLDGKRYSSKRKQKKTSVPPPLEDTPDKVGYFSKLWKKILGRESEDVLDQEGTAMDSDDRIADRHSDD